MDGVPAEEDKKRWAESIRRVKDNLNQLTDQQQSFVKVIITEVNRLKSAKLSR
jgi:hypothetical protein